ncbi:TPA: hypothetical protein ACNVV4_000875 [Pseudomonas aeruginosa]
MCGVLGAFGCVAALGAVEAVLTDWVLPIELSEIAVTTVRVTFDAPSHLSEDVVAVNALRIGYPVLLGEMVVFWLVAHLHVEELAIALSLDLAAGAPKQSARLSRVYAKQAST